MQSDFFIVYSILSNNFGEVDKRCLLVSWDNTK